MILSKFSKVKLACLPTPITELKNLSKTLGLKIIMKRDDLTGLGMGGNKIRKLEYICADAINLGKDTLVTSGNTQSNCCRQTASAAANLGLKCHLLLRGKKPNLYKGNDLLDLFFGATLHYTEDKNYTPEMLVKQLSEKGNDPYLICAGGSNKIGSLGFVNAFLEINDQLKANMNTISTIIFPAGSGGTQAGLIVGASAIGYNGRIIGIDYDKHYSMDVVKKIAEELADYVGVKLSTRLQLESRFASDKMTDGDKLALSVVSKKEGIVLDPTYNARAMRGLMEMALNNEFSQNESILFWNTGGTPTIFEYGDELLIS